MIRGKFRGKKPCTAKSRFVKKSVIIFKRSYLVHILQSVYVISQSFFFLSDQSLRGVPYTDNSAIARKKRRKGNNMRARFTQDYDLTDWTLIIAAIKYALRHWNLNPQTMTW